MKTSTNKLFSFSAEELESSKYKQEKFEIVNCTNNGVKCGNQLSFINACYDSSDYFRSEKNYQRSLDSLRDAFYKTFEITDQSCFKCASFFRSSIIETVDKMNTELNKMTKGFFGKKYYQPSYIKSEQLLQELKKMENFSNFKKNESKQLYIQGIPKKKVS